MTLKPAVHILIGLGLLLVTLLFVGLMHDSEFYSDIGIFIKYKPTFQFVFIDPSYGDQKLTPELQRQADRYANFVYDHKIIDFSSLLVQATMSFLLIGLTVVRQGHAVPLRLVFFHFLICIFPTIIGGVIMVSYYNQAIPIAGFALATLLLNALAAYKLTKGYTQQRGLASVGRDE